MLRRADCAEQHRIAFQTGVERPGRQRLIRLLKSCAADQMLFKLKVVAVEVCDCAQHAHRFGSHFRPNAVARQHRYFQSHF